MTAKRKTKKGPEIMPVGITVGDPAGVGPELLLKALLTIIREDGRDYHIDKSGLAFRLFGPAPVLDGIVGAITATACGKSAVAIDIVATTPDMAGITPGKYSPESGAAALAALTAATAQLADGKLKSLVTGPISKQAFADAGLDYPGQTEFIAEKTGCTQFAMMLGGPKLKVALVTTHLAVRDIADAITQEGISGKIAVCDAFLKDHMGVAKPKIAVTALNPHCGDNGKFGDEEARVIAPAITAAQATGINAIGPLSADTVFKNAFEGQYDMVLAMYHDQGLGPLKLVHFNDAINITMGLPRVRCSPDHGPAFDIAGRGIADPTSMLNAILFAAGRGGL